MVYKFQRKTEGLLETVSLLLFFPTKKHEQDRVEGRPTSSSPPPSSLSLIPHPHRGWVRHTAYCILVLIYNNFVMKNIYAYCKPVLGITFFNSMKMDTWPGVL